MTWGDLTVKSHFPKHSREGIKLPMSGPSLPPDPVRQPGSDLSGLPSPVHEDRGWGDADRTSTGKRAGPTARDSVIQRNTKRDEDKKRGCGGLGATGLAIKCLQKVGGRKEGGTGQIPAGIRDLVIAHLCRERKN